jgi:hypothetical protein
MLHAMLLDYNAKYPNIQQDILWYYLHLVWQNQNINIFYLSNLETKIEFDNLYYFQKEWYLFWLRHETANNHKTQLPQ